MARDVAAFKSLFSRGQFDYGATVPAIRDEDITASMVEASAVFNEELYPTVAAADLAYLYLSAHFLACDTDAADSGGQVRLLQNSRSADGLSESVDIPEWMKSGEFSFYATTYYGQKWLILSKPYLDGVVLVIEGATLP
jgi:hypothetical protein